MTEPSSDNDPFHANPMIDRIEILTPSPSFLSSASSSPWIRKPLAVVHQQEEEAAQERNTGHLQRHLSVWDLIGIGVGGTVGSGIFVLTGASVQKRQSIAANHSSLWFVQAKLLLTTPGNCVGCHGRLQGRQRAFRDVATRSSRPTFRRRGPPMCTRTCVWENGRPLWRPRA